MHDIAKIPTLDKGYVQLWSFAPNSAQIRQLSSLTRNQNIDQLYEIVYIFLNIKCPYFILIPLVSSGLRAVPFAGRAKDAYVPTVDTVRSGSVELDITISKSIESTIDSLMMNQKAYTSDGCNSFTASLTTPVAAYWEGVVHGSMRDLLRFCAMPGLHPLVAEYQKSTINSICTEYKDAIDVMKRINK